MNKIYIQKHISDKDVNVALVNSIEYNGEYLGERYVTTSVKSATPIDFEVGDYLVYRGERFEITDATSIKKQARKGSYGEAFTYTIKMNSLTDELVSCLCLNATLSGASTGTVGGSLNAEFDIHCVSVADLCDLIAANLNRKYGSGRWTIDCPEGIGKTNVTISINNNNCLEVLRMAYDQFGVGYVISKAERVIKIGSTSAINHSFRYGKGNGLRNIEKVRDNDYPLITSLRAVGSDKNMPRHYYYYKDCKEKAYIANFKVTCIFQVDEDGYGYADIFIPKEIQLVDAPYIMLENKHLNVSLVRISGNTFSFNDRTFAVRIWEDYRNKPLYIEVESRYIVSCPNKYKTYTDGRPELLPIANLQLPSFSADNLNPTLESNVDLYGKREAFVSFTSEDDDKKIEEIYPSVTNADNTIKVGSNADDDGIVKDGDKVGQFTVSVSLDFDLNKTQPAGQNNLGTLSMLNGLCGGREFTIQSCEEVSGYYKLTCERVEDSSLGIYLPTKDFKINRGDAFVLLNIEMPDTYVEDAASLLQEKALEYLHTYDHPHYTYNVTIDNQFMATQHDRCVDENNEGESFYLNVKEGDVMMFAVDNDIKIDDEAQDKGIIIDKLTIKESSESIPQYSVSLRNEKKENTIVRIQRGIATATNTATTAAVNAAKKRGFASNIEEGTEQGSAASADKAKEAEHALEADHAALADKATNADNATHATNADNATHATNADKATEATHAIEADNATHADSAAKLDDDSHFDDKYIRKDQDDSTEHTLGMGNANVEHDLKIGQFASGIMGNGAKIDEYGNGEMSSLALRHFLEAPEFRCNKVDINVGDKWRAPGAGIVESVDTSNEVVALKLEDGEIGAVAQGDICIGIFHSNNPADNATADTDDGRGNRTFAGFFTAYFTITSVSGSRNERFTYELRPESARWKHSFHPCEAMKFVCYGSFTNKDRQTSVYETRTYTRMLRDQNTWEIGAANVAMQYGDMSNLQMLGIGDIGDYSIYLKNVYFTGRLEQVDDDGEPIKQINFLTDYVVGQQVKYYYAVAYNGESFLCVNPNGTRTIPSKNDPTNWLCIVEKGESISVLGKWDGNKVPYKQGSIVTFDNGMWIAKKDTYNAPYPIYRYSDGSFVTYYDGGYALISKEINEDDWGVVFDVSGIKDGTSLSVQYSVDANNWHDTYALGDIYMRQRLGTNGAWTAAMRIVGEKGAAGDNAPYQDFEFAVGEENVEPVVGWQDAPPIVPQGKFLWMRTCVVNPNGTRTAWVATRIKGDKGDSVSNLGGWKDGMHVPYLGIVRYGNKTYQCINGNGSNLSPMGCYYTDWQGNRLRLSNGAYVITGETNPDYVVIAVDGADGKTGANGVDGDSREYVYKRFATKQTSIPTPPTSQQDKFVPDGWTDNPQGVSDIEKYEYVITRIKDGKTKQWSAWSNAALWSNWGEKGQDGDGIEYVYFLKNNSTPPQLVQDINDPLFQNDDYLPTNEAGTSWTDDPQGVSEQMMFEFVAQRKKIGGRWQAFTDVALWAKFGERGHTPVIESKNGTWWVDGEDTGWSSNGDDGHSPFIGNGGFINGVQTDKNMWYEWDAKTKSYINTGIKAEGDDGTSVTIKSSLENINGLPTSGAEEGDSYLIDGDLWVYTGTILSDDTHFRGFENVGRIKGDDSVQYYMHTAWANTIDNSDGSFTTSNPSGRAYAYIGTCINTDVNDPETIESYNWIYVKGESITAQTTIKYASHTDGQNHPSADAFGSNIPKVEQDCYLWTWTHIDFSDGKSTDLYSVSRMGVDGKGIKDSHVDYKQSESPIDPVQVTDWGTFPTTLNDGWWLYTRTTIIYSDGNQSTSYDVTQIGKGSAYAGVSEYYAVNNNASTPPSGFPKDGTYAKGDNPIIGGTWKEARPTESELHDKPYLWNFEISRDSAGNQYVTTPICIGNFAKGISSILELYATSRYSVVASGSKFPADITMADWKDEQYDAAPTNEKPYQWNYTITTYNDGSKDESIHISAVRGDDGLSLQLTPSTMTLDCDAEGVLLKNFSQNVQVKLMQGGREITDATVVSVNGSTTVINVGGVTIRRVSNYVTFAASRLGAIESSYNVIKVRSASTGVEYEGTVSIIANRRAANGESVVGAMLRMRGVFENNAYPAYVNNSSYVDVVLHSDNNGKVKYYRLKDGISSSSNVWNADEWVEFSSIKNVATEALIADQSYIKVMNSGKLFVGETYANDSSNGWMMTAGQIYHTRSGLKLTKSGELIDPTGLHLKVGNKTIDDKLQDERDNTKKVLKDTGIDIENRKITLTADQLVAENNYGQKTMWLDDIGNLTIAGSYTNQVQNISVNKGLNTHLLISNTNNNDFSYWNPRTHDPIDSHQQSYSLDVLRCGNVIVIEDIDRPVFLPFFIDKTSCYSRTATRFGTGETHLIKDTELKALLGKRIVVYTTISSGAYYAYTGVGLRGASNGNVQTLRDEVVNGLNVVQRAVDSPNSFVGFRINTNSVVVLEFACGHIYNTYGDTDVIYYWKVADLTANNTGWN